MTLHVVQVKLDRGNVLPSLLTSPSFSLLCDTHPNCGLQLSNGIPYPHCEDLNGPKQNRNAR